MRKSFIIIVFAFIAIFSTTNVVAQKNGLSVSVGAGQFFDNTLSSSYSTNFISTTATQQTSQFTPMVAVKLEGRVSKRFSLGLNYNTLTAQSEFNNQSNGFLFWSGVNSIEKVDAKFSGFSGSIKGFVYVKPTFEAYIGTSVGILSTTESKEIQVAGNNPTDAPRIRFESTKDITALLEASVGMRYFVNKNVGIYAEIGATRVYAVAGKSFQGGVIYRF
jgi:hypothetical protein